ncbi:MAG: hypothetical protein Q8N98_01475, partial [bacterium]|nr:hypothetical protein [bacterium]
MLKLLTLIALMFLLTVPTVAVSPTAKPDNNPKVASPASELKNIPDKDKEKIEELKRKLEEKSKDLRLPAAIVGVLKAVNNDQITVATNKGAETFDIKAAKIVRVATGKITPLEISDLKKEIETKLLLLGRKDKINNTFMVKVVQVRVIPVNIQGKITEKTKNALTVTAKNGTKTTVEISSIKDETEIFTL